MNKKSTRYYAGTIPGAKKRTIPEVSITRGIFSQTGEPRWNISYLYCFTGINVPCHSLDEAFKWLTRYAEEDGFTIEKCKFLPTSDFTLADHKRQLIQLELF